MDQMRRGMSRLLKAASAVDAGTSFGVWRSDRSFCKSHISCHATQTLGAVAQRSEQRTHNPLVPGSNPGGPISTYAVMFLSWCGAAFAPLCHRPLRIRIRSFVTRPVRRPAGKEIPVAEKGGQAPGRPGASPPFSAGRIFAAGRLSVHRDSANVESL